MPEDRRLLPIKVVLTTEGDIRRPEAHGGSRKEFDELTGETRNTLVDQVQGLERYFAASFQRRPDLPGVGRVVLKEKALAKSHRPLSLLSEQTCPVIGVGKFGDLLVSVRPEGVRRLAQRIRSGTSKSARANISTIERIEPYTVQDVVGTPGFVPLVEEIGHGRGVVKIKLFRHRHTSSDDSVLRAFREELARLNCPEPEPLNYAEGQRIYRVRPRSEQALREIASFVGVQRLSPFPFYSVVRVESTPIRRAAPEEFCPPDPAIEYPVVGIIDTGTNPHDQILSRWVVARELYVPEPDRDYDHGSFVAGLISHPRALNHGEELFPETSAKIVDVVALPRVGGTSGGLSEDALVAILDEVIPKYPQVRVWNLSLGANHPCSDDAFSDLAAKVDELQDRHDVLFVIAAGNYSTPPLRGWPPADLGEADRICAPADSVRGITVGSLAHLDNRSSRVKKGEPSPFSRRGPGPVWVPKPDLTHVGGNCDVHGRSYAQTGVLSFDGLGNVAENIGTSFAAPLVSGLVANLHQSVAGASRNMVKALAIHSSLLNAESLTAQELRYRGFGTPPSLARILGCEPWSITLVFEPDLSQGDEFVKSQFPIPDCLRAEGGGVRGTFAMTLVYDPPLDATSGAEYVRSNVEVSLGTYLPDGAGKLQHRSKVPQEPGDVSRSFEKHLVEHGFKWSPVKVYRKEMKRVAGDEWRLLVTVHNRAGVTSRVPQTMVLFVTMLDPQHEAPVYDEVVRAMAQRGWVTADLQIQERSRVGARA